MREQITNEPEPDWCVTVMRPGTALCSPCTFYTSSPPSPFFSPSCHLSSLPCPLSTPLLLCVLYPPLSPPRLNSSYCPQLFFIILSCLLFSLHFFSSSFQHFIPSPCFPRCPSVAVLIPFSSSQSSQFPPYLLHLHPTNFSPPSPLLSSLGEGGLHHELAQVD